MKRFVTILVYLSFIFLIYYFYKQGFLVLEGLKFNVPRLVLSILVLWAGFIVQALSWRNALKIYSHQISISSAIHSHGFPVFTKYIPGKIWTILGRASYAMPSKESFKEFTFISLKEQLIYVWTGLLISIIPLIVFYGITIYPLLVALLFIVFTLVIFNRWFHDFSLAAFKFLFKRELELPFLGFRNSVSIFFYNLVLWLIWMLAFYLLVGSAYSEIPASAALIFPLSVTLGLLAILQECCSSELFSLAYSWVEPPGNSSCHISLT